MLYTRPDYYKEFTCTAEQCEDTCCAGWQIVIDSASMKKYRGKKVRTKRNFTIPYTGFKKHLNKIKKKDVLF